jgi:hypothetical protein
MLFNIFINSFLMRLNADATDIPNCLFYANNKVILIYKLINVQQLLNLAKV